LFEMVNSLARSLDPALVQGIGEYLAIKCFEVRQFLRMGRG